MYVPASQLTQKTPDKIFVIRTQSCELTCNEKIYFNQNDLHTVHVYNGNHNVTKYIKHFPTSPRAMATKLGRLLCFHTLVPEAPTQRERQQKEQPEVKGRPWPMRVSLPCQYLVQILSLVYDWLHS